MSTGFDIGTTGFHMTFENGWTVSVQFGPGHYCNNHLKENAPSGSNNAEIAAWNKEYVWHHFHEENDDVKGFCSPNEVLQFMNMIAAKED